MILGIRLPGNGRREATVPEAARDTKKITIIAFTGLASCRSRTASSQSFCAYGPQTSDDAELRSYQSRPEPVSCRGGSIDPSRATVTRRASGGRIHFSGEQFFGCLVELMPCTRGPLREPPFLENA